MKKHSTYTTFRDVICAALAFLMVMALPTGWLYDLWAGTGTEQGQRPVQWVIGGGSYNRYYLMDLGLRLVLVVVIAVMILHDLRKKRKTMTQNAGG